MGRTSESDTSIRQMGEMHRGKSVNLVWWLKKNKLQRQMRYNKSITDRIWCLNCQHVLGKRSFSNRWRRLVITQVFLLAVVGSRNRLPAVVPQTTARWWVQSSIFFARREMRFDSCHFGIGASFLGKKKKKNYFVIKDFWETLSNRWCYYSLEWCCTSWGGWNFKKTLKKKCYFVFWPWGLLSPISLPGFTVCVLLDAGAPLPH